MNILPLFLFLHFISKNEMDRRMTQEDWFFPQKDDKILIFKDIYLLGLWIW